MVSCLQKCIISLSFVYLSTCRPSSLHVLCPSGPWTLLSRHIYWSLVMLRVVLRKYGPLAVWVYTCTWFNSLFLSTCRPIVLFVHIIPCIVHCLMSHYSYVHLRIPEELQNTSSLPIPRYLLISIRYAVVTSLLCLSGNEKTLWFA